MRQLLCGRSLARSCRAGGSLAASVLAGWLAVVIVWVPVAATAQSRMAGEAQGASAGARVFSCALVAPVRSLFRNSALEKRWRQVEAETEQPLRSLLATDLTSKEALLSLDRSVLERHDWTLTRYLVRVLRELEAPDLQAADNLLRLEAYAEHALRDAMWDGTNGWDVVSAVRAETLETFAALEKERKAGHAASTADQPPGKESASGGTPATPDAEQVVKRLLQEASQQEPYSVGSDCKQPRD